ncbi:unnamed protein product [Trichogramma brassicae]|uniref:Uncharacterized protein n=1 Tax=Trichogramma brassicae TaxID=86971 RepID=A0A6H5I3U2_9HYME|nr:unnamed protein product [Trichogramma brassicae]
MSADPKRDKPGCGSCPPGPSPGQGRRSKGPKPTNNAQGLQSLLLHRYRK